MEELLNALDDYIELLGKELDETAIIAHAHGWRSTRFLEGYELRRRIEQLKNT